MSVWEITGYVLLSVACLLGAALLLLIILIITTSVTVKIKYDGEAEFMVKYLFLTIVRSPESPRQIRKKERKKRREERLKKKHRKASHLKTKEKKSAPKKNTKAASETNEKESPLNKDEAPQKSKAEDNSAKTPREKKIKADKKAKVDLQTVLGVFNAAKPHVKRLFKKIRFSDVLIDIMVGGDDAAKTAVSYGVHCSAIYGLTEFLKRSVTFKAERITIKADFNLPKTDYYARATVKLRVSTLIGCVLWGFLAVNKELNKGKTEAGKKDTVKKSAA